MTKCKNSSSVQLGVMILSAALQKGSASNGLNFSAAVQESGEMAKYFHLVLQSSAAWLCEKQNQSDGSQVPNSNSEGAGLRP